MTPEKLAQVYEAAFPNSRPWTVAEFQDMQRRENIRFFGSEQAFAILQIALDEAEILTCATHPSQQRNGFGRHVLGQAITFARDSRLNRIFLEVAADNKPAFALYSGFGFQKIGRRRGYYAGLDGTRSDALIMELHL